MSSDRKRSRWGSAKTNNDGEKLPAVSDQEALAALLGSAAGGNDNNKPPGRDHQHHPRRDDRVGRGGGEDDNKRRRRDDDRGGRGGGQGRGGYRQNNNNYNNKDKSGSDDYGYYGNSEHKEQDKREFKKSDASSNPYDAKDGEEGEPVDKEKANFGLSGALAQEQVGELKFREPPEARAPNTQWRLYVFKNDEAVETLHIARQSAYLFGRNQDLADIPLLHGSASSQHAVLQYRALPRKEDGRMRCQPYLMDLESTNGSFINGVRLDPARYYQLKKGDVLKFGASTREYVLLTENTTAIK